MQNSTFFIFGANGTAAEVAKDIFLTGCSVSICDPQKVQYVDLASNPFFKPSDIGQ